MTARRACFAGTMMLIVIIPALAETLSKYSLQRKLNCGSFTVRIETVLTAVRDSEAGAYSQSVIMFDTTGHPIARANLDQHRSVSKLPPRGVWLDAIAADAGCFHSHFGKDYLVLDFVCWNRTARTCTTAMDSGLSEWTQIYGRDAKPITHFQGWTDQDMRKMKALGLEPSISQSSQDRLALWF